MDIVKLFNSTFSDVAEFAGLGRKFIYYTSASTAQDIIRGEQIWMRSTQVMNDLNEINHGICLINQYLCLESCKLRDVLNNIDDGAFDCFLQYWNLFSRNFSSEVYIACMSEYDDKFPEGKLSMWRAYGDENSVAFVFNSNFLLNEWSDGYPLYSTKVNYDGGKYVPNFLDDLANGISDLELHPQDLGVLKNMLAWRCGVLAVSVKHSSFSEESEWRVVAIPSEWAPECKLSFSPEKIGLLPQPVVKLPLRDDEVHCWNNVSLPKLLHKILIGPSAFPSVVKQALSLELRNKVHNADDLFSDTGIPIRQNQR
ncbi:DUF2971 domain-containing protein [uncultured Deefgea sp.]|uniref:DUF2971 domain-containing protein n=1 Tax=uncultured Deefgea sp. TaxID=1304914 RepID=UPI002597912C|nr:DUF2971 domain-containing protein [uncultured Deefgea sp.]